MEPGLQPGMPAAYWLGAAVAFGVPVAAAVLYARRPRLGMRVLAGWVALFGVVMLLVIATSLAGVGEMPLGTKLRAAATVLVALALFSGMAVGLWRERRWSLVALCGLLVAAAGLNLVLALRDQGGIEPTAMISYVTLLPALLFMTFRRQNRGVAIG